MASSLTPLCGKGRISADLNEQKDGDNPKNKNPSKEAITAVKRSYKPNCASILSVSNPLEAGGVEPLAGNREGVVNQRFMEIDKSCLASGLASLLQDNPELMAIVTNWPMLPEHIKSAIHTLIQVSSKDGK